MASRPQGHTSGWDVDSYLASTLTGSWTAARPPARARGRYAGDRTRERLARQGGDGGASPWTGGRPHRVMGPSARGVTAGSLWEPLQDPVAQFGGDLRVGGGGGGAQELVQFALVGVEPVDLDVEVVLVA